MVSDGAKKEVMSDDERAAAFSVDNTNQQIQIEYQDHHSVSAFHSLN